VNDASRLSRIVARARLTGAFFSFFFSFAFASCGALCKLLRRGPIGLKEMHKQTPHRGSRERFLRGFAMECRGEMFRWCFARGF
jgi:hypothetical protein